MPEVTFSFIIPTRGRPDSLRTLCESIRANTSRPGRLELVLVVDSDDPPSREFEHPGLRIRKVEVPPGLTMGELNMAGYRAAAGEYLMLMNDDVVLRTPAWDERVLEVFRAYPDGVVLVHLNETIFGRKLCTFPFLTRSFCELAGSVCPAGYVRYRIDDHIHNVFDLLALLGQRRRVFLPDVVFQHNNFVESDHGADYVPRPDIHELDTRLFEALLPERKRLAVAAMERIARYANREKRRVWEERLAPVTDSVAIRDPRHARLWPEPAEGADRPRVTVAVVSADLNSEHTRKCLDLVKAHTRDYDLVIVDNNRASGFNHAREMNRLLEFCRTDYLVLMDDDVFVREGWLEGMLRAMGPDVGVVTPAHYDAQGVFSYAGVVMQPDDSGHHTHVMRIGDSPQHIQTLCSAIMLIDMSRCGHVRLDERYTKYFLDIDYGLRIWETGNRVVCSPWSSVTHIGGGTMQQGCAASVELFETQRRYYVREWVASHRIHALRRGIWKTIPEFAALADLHHEIDGLFSHDPGARKDEFLLHARAIVERLDAVPALKNYMAHHARLVLAGRHPSADDPQTGHAAILLGLSGQQPVLYEASVAGMNIVLWGRRFYALPGDEGVFDSARMRAGGYSRSYEAEEPDLIRQRILSGAAADEPRLPSAEPAGPACVALIQPLSGPLPPGAQPLASIVKRLTRSLPYAGVLWPLNGSAIKVLFDPEYYRGIYPDVAAAGLDPFLHFLTSGAFEGRSPHPLFDTAFYLRKNPDVAASGANPLGHYLKFGAAEGRQPHPLFDPAYYLSRNPDVRNSGANPLVHYCLHGGAERRQPHPWFDPSYYLESCPEARAGADNPLAHFLRGGAAACSPHPLFDCDYYLRENPDAAESGVHPLIHYVLYGAPAGLQPSAEYDGVAGHFYSGNGLKRRARAVRGSLSPPAAAR